MVKKMGLWVAVLVGVWVLPGQAKTATFNSDTGARNAWLVGGWLADSNNSSYSYMRVGYDTYYGVEDRVLLWFDVSSLQGKSDSIGKVTLRLGYSEARGTNFDVAIFKVSPANAGWQQLTATWNQKDPSAGTSWAGSGGLSTAEVDYDPAPLATFHFDGSMGHGNFIEIELPPAVVSEWIAGTNAGLILRFSGDQPAWYGELYSLYHGSHYGPNLTVVYQAAIFYANTGTTISSWPPDYVFSGYSHLDFGPDYGGSTERRSLIYFDLSGLKGKYATIGSATLNMYRGNPYFTEDLVVGVYAIKPANAGWNHSISSWNHKNEEAAIPWAGSAGLCTPGVDYEETPIGSFEFKGSLWPDWTPISVTLSPAAIDRMIQGGNAGILLKYESYAGPGNAQGSAYNYEWGSGGPNLFIEYTLPSRPETIRYGCGITVDGNLDADWADAVWVPLDKVYDYNTVDLLNTDIPEAFYAAKWGDHGNKVYVAVKVRDTAHSFTTDYGRWNGRDAVEVYLHTTGTEPVNYYPNEDTAQQYTVGIKQGTTDQVWTSLTNSNAMPIGAGFQATGKVVGEWIYYEIAMTPFEYFGGVTGLPSVISTLHAGQAIGVDVCAVGHNGSDYAGMKSENAMGGKSEDWSMFGLHTLAPMAGDANGDSQVDVSDLGILAANYGATSGMTWAKGDFNNDGKVDVSDLGILAANYGAGTGSALDFNADAKVLGLVTDGNQAAGKEELPISSALGCGSVGLPLIAGLLLMGVFPIKMDE